MLLRAVLSGRWFIPVVPGGYRERVPATERPDRWVDVYLATIARAVSTCGDFLAATALVIALQTRGSGGFAVAALLVAAAAPPALLGCGLAVATPTINALIPEMVGRERLAKATAVGQTANSIGMLIAPALGGLLVGRFGLRVPLPIAAGTSLALTAAAVAIRTRRGRAPVAGPSGVAERPAWSMRRDPLLRSITIVVAAVVTAVS